MKTAKDPRHQFRREAVRELFAETFTHQGGLSELSKKVLGQIDAIDAEIQASAPAWPLDKLNKIDFAILRLSVYELRNTATPPKVIIDEAVELAKEFGAEASSSFVNGVLGTIFKEKDENR